MARTTEVERSAEVAEQAFATAAEALAAGKTIQKIETPYVTAVAVQKPRDLKIVERKCLEEAALAGEGCFYGWGAGKDRIEGPSIECAMIALRNWGNAFAGAREAVIETPTAYIFTSAFVDIESGVTYQRQFRQSKNWKIYGKMDEERKADVRFQIGQSKADRNAILRALPGWLIDKIIEKAKEGVREKIEKFIAKKSIEDARKYALNSLGKYGVTLERIENKYGKKYAEWDVDMLVLVQGDIAAITKGIESAETLFPTQAEPAPPAAGAMDLSDLKPGDPGTHQGHEPPPNNGKAPETPPANLSTDNTGEMTLETVVEQIAKISKQKPGEVKAKIEAQHTLQTGGAIKSKIQIASDMLDAAQAAADAGQGGQTTLVR